VNDGRRQAPPRRDVDGIVLLDKPSGQSSNRALQAVRRLLGAAKAGHAGTLDPMATGMLPLCFGQATKACGALLGSRKCYRATVRLGTATDTGDAEGAVVEELPVPALDPAAVRRGLAGFTGTIRQVPPMYSALKHEGRPLYALARRGESVVRAPREVQIDRLDLLELGPQELVVDVVCSKGTYVRVLGEDLARALGTCGHLATLRRLWVEPFDAAELVTLERIERWASEGSPDRATAPWLLPVDRAFVGLPRLDLDAAGAEHLLHGRPATARGLPPPLGRLRAYDAEGRFLGLVDAGADGVVRVERLFTCPVVRPDDRRA
jgi:tRNA pseudouridine55 synthase